MKRPIAILFLLLASVSILVHAVVPHHHHTHVFDGFFGVSATHHESHHHCDDCNECSIADTLLTPARLGDNLVTPCHDHDHAHPHFDCLCTTCADGIHHVETCAYPALTHETPPLPDAYAPCTSLRAPPCV